MAYQIGAMEILDERQKYSMISSWSEYLCIEQVGEKEFEISVRGATALAEARQYFVEESEEYELPDYIDGHCVLGMNDGVVIGEPLEVLDDAAPPFRFSSMSNQGLDEWLESVDWATDFVRKCISRTISVQ